MFCDLLEELEDIAYLIGLSREEFLDCDYSEFRKKIYAYKKRKEILDGRTALMCATLVNVNRGKKGKKAKIDDFMPKKQKEKKQQTDEEMFNMVKVLNQAFGGD